VNKPGRHDKSRTSTPRAGERGGPGAKYSAAAILGTLLGLSATAACSQEIRQSAFHIAERWTVGGAGGWDYLALDASGRRLFVTRDNRVDVIDTTSGMVTGSIADTAGAHGVALAPQLQRGYISNGRTATVTAFDLETLHTLATVKVSGINPDAIVFEPVGKHVLTFNGGSSNASVLDPTTLAAVATIALPDKPEFAVADASGHVFVNIESDAGQLVVIDALSLKVIATWPLPGCARPTGLALDRAHKRLFSVCSNKVLAVTDADSGRGVARIAIGEHPDAAAYDAGLGLIFSSNGEGTMTVIHEDDADHYRGVATLPTQKSARTLALDPALHRIYLVAADFGPTPQATASQPRPRAPVLLNSFTVLVAAPR
jgi:YVTN family beta-propeller protein